MQIDIHGVHTYDHDLCSTCVKDNNECVFKKALSNYHGGGDMPLILRLTGCPECIRIENRSDRISWGDFDTSMLGPYVTLNPNVTVRLNTGETND